MFWTKEKGREALFNFKTILKMLPRSNSKLCFELLEILSAAQNHLPLQGAEKNSEVVFSIVANNVISAYWFFIAQHGQALPGDYGNHPKAQFHLKVRVVRQFLIHGLNGRQDRQPCRNFQARHFAGYG